MLQNIAENSKNSDSSSKKTTEIISTIAKKIPTKTTPELPDKRDSSEKTVSNVDKLFQGQWKKISRIMLLILVKMSHLSY